jgi:hypothetical protein
MCAELASPTKTRLPPLGTASWYSEHTRAGEQKQTVRPTPRGYPEEPHRLGRDRPQISAMASSRGGSAAEGEE